MCVVVTLHCVWKFVKWGGLPVNQRVVLMSHIIPVQRHLPTESLKYVLSFPVDIIDAVFGVCNSDKDLVAVSIALR